MPRHHDRDKPETAAVAAIQISPEYIRAAAEAEVGEEVAYQTRPLLEKEERKEEEEIEKDEKDERPRLEQVLRRRCQITIAAQADSMEQLIQTLRSIEYLASTGMLKDGVLNGSKDSVYSDYGFRLTEDPDMDHDKYVEGQRIQRMRGMKSR